MVTYFDTASGIRVVSNEVTKVLNEGSFLIPALHVDESLDWENVMSYGRLIRRVKICGIHCFDGRDFWRNLWRDLLMTSPADEVMRISLAGAATSPKRFLAYLDKYNQWLNLEDIIYPVFTHDPCGRFPASKDWRQIQSHGWNIITGFGERGYKSFGIHYHYNDNRGLEPHIFDPYHVVDHNPYARLIVEASDKWKGRQGSMEDFSYFTNLTMCSTSLALGYPPRIEDNRMVLCDVDHGENQTSIIIAQSLNQGEPVPVRISRFYFNQL